MARYLEQFPSIAGRIHIIPNGVNPARFAHIRATGRLKKPGQFTVGFLGTLKPWHGLSVLATAFAELRRLRPDARLLVAGDGPEKESFAAELEQAGVLDAVTFAGAVTPDAVPRFLAAMDVAVAPYPAKSDFYFSPLKVYEYLAASLPVVASAVGQLEALIENGVNGLLCPPGESLALTNALVRLHDDAGLRRTLGSAARKAVTENHTWIHIASQILRIAGLGEEEGAMAVARTS